MIIIVIIKGGWGCQNFGEEEAAIRWLWPRGSWWYNDDDFNDHGFDDYDDDGGDGDDFDDFDDDDDSGDCDY